jgi:hypothetical protein
MQVKCIKITSGYMGREVESFKGNCLAVTKEEMYKVYNYKMIDDAGNVIYLRYNQWGNLFALDRSSSEGFALFEVVND